MLHLMTWVYSSTNLGLSLQQSMPVLTPLFVDPTTTLPEPTTNVTNRTAISA